MVIDWCAKFSNKQFYLIESINSFRNRRKKVGEQITAICTISTRLQISKNRFLNANHRKQL